jgi:hypothetical protein
MQGAASGLGAPDAGAANGAAEPRAQRLAIRTLRRTTLPFAGGFIETASICRESIAVKQALEALA